MYGIEDSSQYGKHCICQKKCNLFLCYFHQFHIIQYQYHSDFLFLINTDKKIAKRLHITENFYISAILHGSLLPPPRGLIMSVFFKKKTPIIYSKFRVDPQRHPQPDEHRPTSLLSSHVPSLIRQLPLPRP